MIKSIEIEGFRSLRHVRLDLRPLNVLIGPNQSGKTNILDALDFLAQAVQGKLSPALYHSRGGLANLLWAGEGAKHIRFRIVFEPGTVTYTFTIEQQSQGHVIAEEYVEVGPEQGYGPPLFHLGMKRGAGFLFNSLSEKNEEFTLESREVQELAIAQFLHPKAYPVLRWVRARTLVNSDLPRFRREGPLDFRRPQGRTTNPPASICGKRSHPVANG